MLTNFLCIGCMADEIKLTPSARFCLVWADPGSHPVRLHGPLTPQFIDILTQKMAILLHGLWDRRGQLGINDNNSFEYWDVWPLCFVWGITWGDECQKLKAGWVSILNIWILDFTREREISWIFDIGHWTSEYPMTNIEYPANVTFLLYPTTSVGWSFGKWPLCFDG